MNDDKKNNLALEKLTFSRTAFPHPMIFYICRASKAQRFYGIDIPRDYYKA